MSNIENDKLGWSESVVMICSKCAKQFDNSSALEYPEKLRMELKTMTKEQLGQKVRVVTTSCLNICPENKITIVKATTNGTETFKSYAVTLETSAHEVMESIIR